MVSPRIAPGELSRLLAGWRSAPGAGYRALATALARAVRDGRLTVGTRLPSERELASLVGASRTTVTSAYAELRRTGYLESRRGSGSYAALPRSAPAPALWTHGLVELDAPAPVDLTCAALRAPAILLEAVEEAVTRLPGYLGFRGYDPLGLPVLRRAIAARYTAMGLATTPAEILVTSGAMHALDLCLDHYGRAGSRIVVDSPGFPPAAAAARAHGYVAVPVGVDVEHGFDVDAIVGAIRLSRPRVVYAIADFQNPTGHVLEAPDRTTLVAAAEEEGAVVLADESFRDLRLDRDLPPALASYARRPDSVLSIGSLSKPVWGGCRVGWVRGPASVVRELAALRSRIDISSPVLDQLVGVALLDRLDELLADRVEELAAARDALLAALGARAPGWRFTKPAGGLCLWVELDAPVSSALAAVAARDGVGIVPGTAFTGDATGERFLRIPFSCSPAELVEAVDRLVEARGRVGARVGQPFVLT